MFFLKKILYFKKIYMENLSKTIMFVFLCTTTFLCFSQENTNSSGIVPYDELDTDPSFIGGETAMLKFLSDNLIYPETAKTNNIKGRVIVEFVVDKNGNISSPKVLRSPNKILDEEAIRVVSKMPKWKPGTKDGKPVSTKMVLPIKFEL